MICKKSNIDGAIYCAKCVIRKKSIFGSLKDDEIAKISKYIERKSNYPKGEYLIKEGEKACYSLCIKSGYLILGTYLEDGSRQIFKVIFPGEFVGFNNSDDYSYFVQAITDVDACVIDDLSVKELLKNHNNVALRLINTLISNSSSYQQYFLGFGRKTAQEALAYLIMDLSTRLKEQATCSKNKDELYFFPLNQEDMADVLGITKVHVSRVISQFKKEGLIECRHKKLKVLNEDKLASIAAYPPAPK
ncbi:Transcriptional activator protein fnrL [uncultured Candidatus Thioglobus sp.]|nr:Transcriptional activator protein fnrL [uncultured Candidatus Thioglobus sp.]